jgi:calmodulin
MQPIMEAELPNLLKEVGLLPTVEGVPTTQPKEDGKLSFAEFFKIAKERLSKIDTAVLDAFEMFDINRDGHVSKQEIKTVMAQLGEAINNEKVDSIVRAADIDSDGIISIEEFHKSVYPALSTMVRSAAEEMSKKKREENASLESFKIFDVDGDGFVTAEEIKAVLNKLGRGATDEAVAAMIKAADVDGDGRISRNEFL